MGSWSSHFGHRWITSQLSWGLAFELAPEPFLLSSVVCLRISGREVFRCGLGLVVSTLAGEADDRGSDPGGPLFRVLIVFVVCVVSRGCCCSLDGWLFCSLDSSSLFGEVVVESGMICVFWQPGSMSFCRLKACCC